MKRTETSSISAHRVGDELTPDQVVLLKIALEKFLDLAWEEGVAEDELIAFLDSGTDLLGLLDYVTSKTANLS